MGWREPARLSGVGPVAVEEILSTGGAIGQRNMSNSNRRDDDTQDSEDLPVASELVQIGTAFVGTLIAARVLAAISRMASVLAAPAAAFYLFSTCPAAGSFDGKRELKRVLRGDKVGRHYSFM